MLALICEGTRVRLSGHLRDLDTVCFRHAPEKVGRHDYDRLQPFVELRDCRTLIRGQLDVELDRSDC